MSEKKKLNDEKLDKVAGGAIKDGEVTLISLGPLADFDGKVSLGFLNPSGSMYSVTMAKEKKDQFMELITSQDFTLDELKERGWDVAPAKEG